MSACPPLQRVLYRSIVNMILIRLDYHISVPRMPAGRDFVGPHNNDVLRKPLIQRIRHPLRRNGRRRVKYRHITERVNPRIRPAGADNMDILPCQLRQHTVQHLLNRDPVRLDLPAAVIRTVIGNNQPDTPLGDFGDGGFLDFLRP